jgi:hypothetical protein
MTEIEGGWRVRRGLVEAAEHRGEAEGEDQFGGGCEEGGGHSLTAGGWGDEEAYQLVGSGGICDLGEVGSKLGVSDRAEPDVADDNGVASGDKAGGGGLSGEPLRGGACGGIPAGTGPE